MITGALWLVILLSGAMQQLSPASDHERETAHDSHRGCTIDSTRAAVDLAGGFHYLFVAGSIEQQPDADDPSKRFVDHKDVHFFEHHSFPFYNDRIVTTVTMTHRDKIVDEFIVALQRNFPQARAHKLPQSSFEKSIEYSSVFVDFREPVWLNFGPWSNGASIYAAKITGPPDGPVVVSTVESDPPKCAVCGDYLRVDAVRSRCGSHHAFHNWCLDKHYRTHGAARCPVCNEEDVVRDVVTTGGKLPPFAGNLTGPQLYALVAETTGKKPANLGYNGRYIDDGRHNSEGLQVLWHDIKSGTSLM